MIELARHEDRTDVVAEEHWARRDGIDLFVLRKHSPVARAANPDLPVLFLVHGSSFSSRTSYDLDVPGKGEYSAMNAFARLGYDVWTMDHEGYGRSTHTDGFSFVADGVKDLEAAMPLVEAATGKRTFAFFGSSSGALRAGRFANAHPKRVSHLALAALVWTGKGSPTLAKRAQRLDEWRASNRRIVDEAAYQAIFSRDVTGLTIPELPKAAAASEMANGGGSVPNGTYIDMCVNLPLVDPTAIACPVLIFRGDHDGIATDEDVLGFYDALPTRDKQIVMVAGQAHNTAIGINRHRWWHALHSFLTMPGRVDG
ncbi:MAG: alpha/beta fold hydrolase [Ectothiorhodospiraceae bacterium]|nr:alpha/beta fold hydrolase [Ectothiorhodospiraceae bacterium]